MAVRYQLNKNKYLLDPEVDRLEAVLTRELQGLSESRQIVGSLAPLREQKPTDIRDALILFLALRTGGRAMELLTLRKVDINTYDQTLFIRGLKGSNDRELPIAPFLFEALVDYAQDLKSSAELFPIGYHRLRQIWDWYRPAPKKFHSLRHTFAIRLYRKTKDLRLVQVALGHRNITNTMVYADYVYSQQELRKLIL